VRRHDVSSVPLQGGYVARQCPVRAQNTIVVPAEPVAPSSVLERRFDQARHFDDAVVADLVALHGAAVTTAGSPDATAEAMARRVPLLLGGQLPVDHAGRRVGRPDLLVLAPGGGYRPVDVKHHLTLEPARPDGAGIPGRCSPLDRPWLEDATIDDRWCARKREADLLQLAHYQRMLEAAGQAAPDGRHGGIIGVERRVVWYDLDAPVWRTPSSSGRQKQRTTMEIYDFEFDFRLDVMAVAAAHQRDAAVGLLVVPVRIGECDQCPWWNHCRPQLVAGSGDVSLLPRVGWREWKIHHDHGVTDRAALAALDVGTAKLVAAGVDVAAMLASAEGVPAVTPVADLGATVRPKSQLAALDAAGMRNVADLARLDATTASYSGTGLASLADQIDLARAVLGPDPIYRKRGVATIAVPRADVEVDVDMENVEEGVYLWGALVTIRRGPTSTSEYHPFVTWDRLTPDVEVTNSLRFWHWLTALRDATHEQGHSFHAYCYNASAENTYLRKLGLAAGLVDEITAFTQSGEWVDMLRVVDRQLTTGASNGLKAIAPITGFRWEVDDPGGGESMVRYDLAVDSEDGAEREASRRWLLTYNQGDVEATLALRDWLEARSGAIASIESLGAAQVQ